MKVSRLRLKNFQSFGPKPTEVDLSRITFLLGPNGSGKTAVLLALARLFSPVQAMRRIQLSDFHAPFESNFVEADNELWLEVDIEFEEAADGDQYHPSIPPFFTHMALEDAEGVPRVRIRLTATVDIDEYVEERIEYITQVDANGEPTQRSEMSRHDRAAIEVHYLPARRDPLDHLNFATTSLFGRMLRSVDWSVQREEMVGLTDALSASIVANVAVAGIGTEVRNAWAGLHKGSFFKDPSIAFGRGELEGVLRQLTMTFAPGPGSDTVDFDRLSDGQKSMLYLALVIAWRGVARKVLSGAMTAFDPDKLRPPVHMILALEEPENSLAPQHLGRILHQLRSVCAEGDIQGVVATHSPALLHRVEPETIRFLRLAADRTTQVRTVVMPDSRDEAAKYVREAVRAYPELYFARLVILGEGASEQIVLPRILAAAGLAENNVSVSVVPLGGRHVHHFWRLLERLEIPYVTLLDLDSGRYQGGWGRVRYVANQLDRFKPGVFDREEISKFPNWDDDVRFPFYCKDSGALRALEDKGVFFSHPVDLDLMMLEAYPEAYGVSDRRSPTETTKTAVLGKKYVNGHHFTGELLALFDEYRRQFIVGSKPASHLNAMAAFDGKDANLIAGLPAPLDRLINAVKDRLKRIPE
ncbi:AAA family ATPase [Corynebacterium sp. CCM 9186]|uniref:ATP-dependent nuclease n=1 Tax=Corynebacterium meridianum TaxID=2765363 RepID=UPI0020060472|nr:AAA family ATPase [Corynebacterium meridianum]MCK7676818.1 AAA family ATPase [Corynebacterium meridianum]